MGMYDRVICERTLPDGYVPGERTEFQSKTFADPDMEKYIITAAGRLAKEIVEYETVPEEERPYYGTDRWNGVMKHAGSIRRKVVGIHDTAYVGRLEFHDWDEASQTMRQYVARFAAGDLKWIRGGLGADRRWGRRAGRLTKRSALLASRKALRAKLTASYERPRIEEHEQRIIARRAETSE